MPSESIQELEIQPTDKTANEFLEGEENPCSEVPPTTSHAPMASQLIQEPDTHQSQLSVADSPPDVGNHNCSVLDPTSPAMASASQLVKEPDTLPPPVQESPGMQKSMFQHTKYIPGKEHKIGLSLFYIHPLQFQAGKLMIFRVGGALWPKKHKRKRGDDDFLLHFGRRQTIIGVADGVGSGSGLYARTLMANAAAAIEKQPPGYVNLKQVLNQAFLETKTEGSSTACLVTLKGENLLFGLNIGDSGFLVIRDNKIVYRSPIQQSRFNCPFQLGVSSGFTLANAQELVVKVQSGDILVVATDGLFDNLYPHEIEKIVKKCPECGGGRLPGRLAQDLAKRARKLSLERDYFSPFTKAAVDAGKDFKHWKGGKSDDITIMVANIV